jgi:hypothetical protein
MGNLDILYKLWDWAIDEPTPQDLKEKFFLAKDDHEMRVWHIAAKQGNVDILHKLWKFANEVLTHEELLEFLLAKDITGITAWYLAAEYGKYVLSNSSGMMNSFRA